MRRPGGYAVITNPAPGKIRLDGGRVEMACEGVTELDTVTCAHCGAVNHIRPKERPEDLGGLCKSCMKLICPRCLDQGCTPLERQIEAMEQRDYLRRSNGW